MSFLCTRVKAPMKSNQNKLLQVFGYLSAMKDSKSHSGVAVLEY
jgi:hypothetical protein